MMPKPRSDSRTLTCERGDEEDEAEQQPEDPPLHPAERVAVQGGLADLLRERGVALVELLLDLVEDALFVFGERHRPNSLLGGAPVGPAEAIIAQAADGDNAAGAAHTGRVMCRVRIRPPLLLAPPGEPEALARATQAGRTDGLVPEAAADVVDGLAGLLPGARVRVVQAELLPCLRRPDRTR